MEDERRSHFQDRLYPPCWFNTEAKVTVHFATLNLEKAQALAEWIQENPSLRTLVLDSTFGRKGKSGCQELEALAAGLRGSSVIELGLLNLNPIGNEGAQVLSTVLKETSIQSLNISHTGLGSKGVQALAEGLRSSSVTSLNLSAISVTNAGALALALVLKASSVRSLRLWNCKVTTEGAQALAEGLRSSGLTSLDMSYNSIGDEGAQALAAALKESSVTRLLLQACQIDVDGARALAQGLKSSRVTELCLNFNSIMDEGATAFGAVLPESCLQCLGMYDCGIGVDGAEAIAQGLKSSPVTNLNLSENSVTDEGAKAIAAVLKGSSVQQLRLECEDIGSQGAEALLNGLRDSPVIVLELDNAVVDADVLGEIQAVLEVNKARSFVLNMKPQQSENAVHLNFHTLAGNKAVVLTWSMERPVHELPETVLASMRSSGFPLPFTGLGTHNLRFVRPDGHLLDAGPSAAPLAKQLGLSAPPPSLSSKRPQEDEADTAPSKRPRDK